MPNILTQSEHDNLKEELDRLVNVERHEIAKDLKEAISQGDLSDNAAYTDAKDRQAALEGRIKKIKAVLFSAKILGEVATGGEVIHVGRTFKVQDLETGEERQFTIVGSQESAPAAGKISFDSPLGSAFLEKRPGDEVEIVTPAGKKQYRVVEIR